ncbi:MAG TPA: hypothetical protein VFN41_01090 [Candidatus Limnocylindrales bacterium]|nr:hypothetical protein [Candidatus Limnocylindrales bacterium]
MTLREILEASATETPGVEVGTDEDGATAWSYGGTVFALLSADGASASFLLDPIVANAAARTPDVKRSRRGDGWVDMTPKVIDRHVYDRARAWFLSGHRRLTGPGL